ncbi:hypothetical protein ACFFMN_23300 [Planobispora siamensis]|uniref:Uncharacterized protein n=1 Tax=Planobispora siamensis TaxID=936338 RepID=A0A8J3SMZ1_9ACTN|nr:hypothetical protein [Planobispora siamensis]GIH95289.1 hypothetical protein Psi01_59190 [Planobispora siamensis]
MYTVIVARRPGPALICVTPPIGQVTNPAHLAGPRNYTPTLYSYRTYRLRFTARLYAWSQRRRGAATRITPGPPDPTPEAYPWTTPAT